jgi:ornithine cyclodeaminase/alanine dehydrogenase-like protein (mu-crystallin family)
MSEAIEILTQSYIEEASGEAANRTKSNIHIPVDDGAAWYRYCTMEGGSRKLGVVAIRIKSDVVNFFRDQGRFRSNWFCVRPGQYGGLILLYSAKNGELLAILNDGEIQHFRVGATAAIAAKRMADPCTTAVGILGSGGMARSHVAAYKSVFANLRRAQVYSPNEEHRNSFCRELEESFELDVTPVNHAREVFKNVQLVASCTDSLEPTFSADWLEDGTHLTAVTLFEMDDSVYPRLHRIVTYRENVATHHFTTPEDFRPPALGAAVANQLRKLDVIALDRRGTLADLLLGKIQGRESPEEINFFNSEGSGIQFAAVAKLAYEKCRAKTLGIDLPIDWFLQDIRN